MIDDSLSQPRPRRSPLQGIVLLLVLLLFLVGSAVIFIQAVRRCGDPSGAYGQLLWGDLRPLGLPILLFFIGISLLILRLILMSRRVERQREQPNRRYGLLSLALLPIFFGIIFTCSQF